MALGLVAVSLANVSCQHAYQHVQGVSLSEQNVVLYSYGVILNGLLVFYSNVGSGGLFHDYTGWTLSVIM